ncbi:MAG TPA: hypothetical protein VLA92_00370 [Candidatus Saccharimonadales bacterium]|nr:hypothetical protein [Candidatus Saccharimonadales bacterium]
MKLILPPHELNVSAGPGSALRATARDMLAMAGVVCAIDERRPVEQLAVEHELTTPEDILATHGLANLLTTQQTGA